MILLTESPIKNSIPHLLRYDSVLIEETLPEDNFDVTTDTNATKVLLPEIQKNWNLKIKNSVQNCHH